MLTHKEIKNFFYSEDMRKITDSLLKRYEPTNLDKLDILRVIYPAVINLYKLDIEEKEFKKRIIEKADEIIMNHLFPHYNNNQEESSEKIYERWKNGDNGALYELLEKNQHLISLTLITLQYDDPFSEDLYQEGFKILINLIKEYDKNSLTPFTAYLNPKLKRKIKRVIKEHKRNMQAEEKYSYISSINGSILTYKDYDAYNNIDVFINREYLKFIKQFLMKTSYLNFMEKVIVSAKLGFINEVVINSSILLRNFDYTRQNIKRVLDIALNKIRMLKQNESYFKLYEEDIKKDHSLFEHLPFNKKEILEYLNLLEPNEIWLLKQVWSNDFSALSNLDNINLNEEQVILYYKVISKIYNNLNKEISIYDRKKNISNNSVYKVDREVSDTIINIDYHTSFDIIWSKIKIYFDYNRKVKKLFSKVSYSDNIIDNMYYTYNIDLKEIASSHGISVQEVEIILQKNKKIKQTIIDMINSIDGFIVCSNKEKGQAFIKK